MKNRGSSTTDVAAVLGSGVGLEAAVVLVIVEAASAASDSWGRCGTAIDDGILGMAARRRLIVVTGIFRSQRLSFGSGSLVPGWDCKTSINA